MIQMPVPNACKRLSRSRNRIKPAVTTTAGIVVCSTATVGTGPAASEK